MRILPLISLLFSAFFVSARVTLPVRNHATAASAVNFLSLGDWGKANSDQANVAKQMATTASNADPLFLLALGDNFYENGVTSDTDPLWKTDYTDVYTAQSLQLPWYVILGNHDHYSSTKGQAEIDYFNNKRDNRWILPDFYYTQTFNLTTASGSFSAQIVMIDTVLLSGVWSDKLWSFSPKNTTKAQDQYQWIESTLKSSTADWLFVCGHYPVYSGGEHGNTDDLLQNLKPLLEKYNVDAYFNGHDHNLQHLQSSTVNYWVSGNGAKRGSYSPIPQALFGIVDPGFMLHSMNATHMHTQMIDLKGKMVYEFTQPQLKKTQRVNHEVAGL